MAWAVNRARTGPATAGQSQAFVTDWGEVTALRFVPDGKGTVMVFAASLIVLAMPPQPVVGHGAVKLLAVTPLTCVAAPTWTLLPVVESVATKAVTLVPLGKITAMLFVASLIVPVTPATLKVVMALAVRSGAYPPPQAARNPLISKAMNHGNTLE